MFVLNTGRYVQMAGFVLPSAHEIKEKRLFEERRTLFGKLQQGKDELYQELEALKPSTDLRVYPTKYVVTILRTW